MKNLSAIFLFCFFLSACGVKGPPLAPERAPVAVPPKLDCSVYDPTCDKKEKNYDPAKDPAKQAKPSDPSD